MRPSIRDRSLPIRTPVSSFATHLRTPAAIGALLASLFLAAALVPSASSEPAIALVGEPTTPVLDDFNRANEDPLDQWTNWAGSVDGSGQTLEVLSNTAGHNDGDGVTADSYRPTSITGDAEVHARVAGQPENNQNMFLYLGLQELGTSAWDGYRLTWFHWIVTDGLYIQRIDNGQATTIAGPFESDPATGQRLLLRRVGSNLELWQEVAGVWSQRLSVADSTYTSGQIGFGSDDDDGRWDDFGGSGPQAGPPPTPVVPLTQVLDDFNRADEDPLVQGGAWASTPISGSGLTLEVLANAARHNEGAFAYGDSYREVEYVGDTEVYATLAATPDNDEPVYLYLHLRQTGGSGWDGYRAYFQKRVSTTPDRLWIQKIVNGGVSTLASTTAEFSGGDIYLLRRIGNALQLWRKRTGAWTNMVNGSDAEYTRGMLGLGVDDDSGRWDDFGGGAIGGLKPSTDQSRGVCGGVGPDAIATTVCLSDPVNTLTGALITQVSDLTLPGSGVPFSWGRSYTSEDPTIGRLGPGWTDSYSASLQLQPNGDVIVHGEEGQLVPYTKQPDASFLGVAGALSTLTQVAGGYELVRKDQEKRVFDAQGRLSAIEDRNGEGVALAYDGQGRLGSITDAAGRTATVSYNAQDLVSGVQTQDGRSVGYGYTDGRLTSHTDVRGKPWTYTYDAGGRLATIVDPLNHTQVTNVYGAEGRVQTQTDALQKTTTFAWDAATQTATVTDANSKVWKDQYFGNLLFKRTDPLGKVTQFEYDADLNTSAVVGPRVETTTMSYDVAGNLLQATAPASLTSAQKTFVYNARNDPTQVTDARNKLTSYTYAPAGNTESVTQDGTLVGAYTYDPAGRVETFTDGNSKTTTYTYFPNGNLESVSDALGNKTTYTYDTAGRVLTRVDPKGNCAGCTPANFTWTYTYNAAGQLLTETDPLAKVTTHTYDDAGNELTVTDANSKTTAYTYDNANRLLTVTAPDTGVTTYTYDAVGNKLTEKNALDRTTTHTYDSANRLASTTTPSGAKTTYFYDADGNLTKQVDPRGNVTGANPDDYDTLFTYDAAGRLLTESDPLGNVTTHTYDAVGNEIALKDPRNKTTTSAYDGKNRLSSMTAPDTGVIGYTYDAVGNKLTETDPRNKTTTSAYDGANRLSSVTTPTDGKTTYTYDPNGNQLTMVEPRGNTQGANPADFTWTYTYDRVNRRLTETDPLGNITTSTYDGVGNQLSVEDANEHTTSYTHDPLNRLKTVTAPDLGVTTYGYDLAGNLTSRQDAKNHTTSYAYDVDNRRTTVSSPIGQVWTTTYDPAANVASTTDANGNATPTQGDGTTKYNYDAGGRLTRIDYSDSTPDVSLAYDAAANRTEMLEGAALDDFNRPDENPLSQAGAWSSTGTTGNSRLRVLSNRAAGTVSTTSRSHRAGVLTDLEAYVTVAVKPGSGNSFGITLCNREFGGSTWDGYRVIWVEASGTANDSLRVERITNNAVAASLATATLEFAPGNRLNVRRKGATIEAWVDQGGGWTKVLETSDATYPDGTVGLEIRGTGGRLDDFVSSTVADAREAYAFDDVNRLKTITRGADAFSYLYDLAGNVTRRTYPDATITDYGHDDDGRLQSATSAAEATSYGYDAAGNLTQTTLPSGNGYVETRVHDRSGRLTEVTSEKAGTPLARFVSTLDPVGNPLQIVRTGSLTETQTYTYDPNDRLSSVCFQTSCPGGGDPKIAWTYDLVGNRSTEQRTTGTTAYAYNDADQLLSAGPTSYTYDQNGNELSAGSRTFTYDLANRLKTTTLGTTTTSYVYDGDGKRVQAATGSQASDVTNVVWDANHALPQIALERDGAGTLRSRYVYGARRISMTSGSATGYYLYDGLGSVTNLTSAAGETQWTWGYEPFGSTRTEIEAGSGQPANVMKFTGEFLDPTGLYHLRARQYDPSAGRFLALDPLDVPFQSPSVSPYAYVDNRPTVLIDPSGQRGKPTQESQFAAAIAGSTVGFVAQRPEASPPCTQGFGAGHPRKVYSFGFANVGKRSVRTFYAFSAGFWTSLEPLDAPCEKAQHWRVRFGVAYDSTSLGSLIDPYSELRMTFVYGLTYGRSGHVIGWAPSPKRFTITKPEPWPSVKEGEDELNAISRAWRPVTVVFSITVLRGSERPFPQARQTLCPLHPVSVTPTLARPGSRPTSGCN